MTQTVENPGVDSTGVQDNFTDRGRSRKHFRVWARVHRDEMERLGLQAVLCRTMVDKDGEKKTEPLPETTGKSPAFGTFILPQGLSYIRPAFRPPTNAFVLDVDRKPGKPDGALTLARVEEDLGELPATQRLTAHGFDNPAGRMLFRIPDGFFVNERFFDQFGGEIDVVRTGWRYCMTVGDEHPRTGAPVVCYNPDGSVGDVWPVSEWPMLPPDWLLALAEWEADNPSSALDLEDDPDEGALDRMMSWASAKAMSDTALARVTACIDGGAAYREALMKASQTIGGFIGSIYPDESAAEAALFEAVAKVWKNEPVADEIQLISSGLERGGSRKWVVMPPPEPVLPAEAEPAESVQLDMLASPMEPALCARQLGHYLTDNDRTVLVSQAEWLRYDSTHYEPMSAGKVRSLLYLLTEHVEYLDGKGRSKKWAPNPSKINALTDAYASLHDTFADMGEWIGRMAERPDTGPVLIPCRNGILDVQNKILLPHDPRWYFTYCLPADYNPDAAAPHWGKLLEAQWGDQPLTMQSLQEWFGYVLSGRTDLHKAALLYGPRRSAKGTIARVLQSLLGQKYSVGLSLSSFTSGFGLGATITSPLAVLGDVRWSGLQSASQVVSRILEITGEDRITIDRKYRDPWSGTLPTRLMFMSNDEPTLPDTSGALASRFLVFATRRSFLDQEDPQLGAKLHAELAGILNWAIEGYDRLSSVGMFTKPEGADAQLRRMAGAGSNVSGFLYECCDMKCPDVKTSRNELYEAYRLWCIDQHIDQRFIVDKPRFGQALNSTVTQPLDEQPRVHVGGKRVRVYVGVKLRPEYRPDAPGAEFDDGFDDY